MATVSVTDINQTAMVGSPGRPPGPPFVAVFSAFGAILTMETVGYYQTGNLSLVRAAVTLAYPFAAPLILGALRRTALELASSISGEKNRRSAVLAAKQNDPEIFNVNAGYNTRNSDFAKRVGAIFDELSCDAEGKKLVDEARKQGIVVQRSKITDRNQVLALFNAVTRRIEISWNGNEMQSLGDPLVRELILAVAPHPYYGKFSFREAHTIAAASAAACSALPLYLGWQLKEAGRPYLWSELTRASGEGETRSPYSSTEKYSLAVQSSSSPREALQDFIRDWCMSDAHAYFAKGFEPNKRLSLPEIPPDFSGRIKWGAKLPVRALYRYFKLAPAKAYNLVAGNTVARWPRDLARWTASNYLQDENFDILKAVQNPPSITDARDRALKETAIVDRDTFISQLFAVMREQADLLGLNNKVQDSTHVVYATPGPLSLAVVTDGQLSEKNMPKSPTSLRELWKAVEGMASPLCETHKYAMVVMPVIFRRSPLRQPATNQDKSAKPKPA